MKRIRFNSYKDLAAAITCSVRLYSIPSDVFVELLEHKMPGDRWIDNINRLRDLYGNTFTITNQLEKFQNTIAETFFIKQDQKVTGYFSINNRSIQPGVKRFQILKILPIHNVKVAVFDDIKFLPKKYIDFTVDNEYEVYYSNLWEIHEPSWPKILKDRLKEQPLYVELKGNNIYVNSELLFYRKIYKAPWSII
tara:strand:- start:720 stop:1301 length:582 start_codon:yes stop_codon:yes gene_type:complete